ncbi:MAG: hypothetical protein MJZ96_07800 [Paludibacteraceae bacterium]|nr:hypothetical protein [Paludibacteraceae bacterium]
MVKDFVMAALPWVILGLIVAVLAAFVLNRNKKDFAKKQSSAWYISSMLAYIVSIVMILDGNSSSGITWLCIGSAFLCYGSIDLMKEKKKEEEDNRKDGEDKAE